MNQAYFRLLAMLILLIPQSHFFAQGVNQYFWVPNAPVNSIQKSDSGVFIGGDFDDIGPCTGHLVFLDSLSGQVLSGFPTITGTVYASTTDGRGGQYIGGDFRYKNIFNVAHILANGLIDTIWTPNPNGPVYSLVHGIEGTLTSRDNQIYLGGDFTIIGGEARQNLAAVDTLTGITDPLFLPEPDGPVLALDLDRLNNTLYLGGNFTTVFGIQRVNLARVDMTTGTLFFLPMQPSLDLYYPCNGPVRALKFRNDSLFVGGDFTFAGPSSRFRFVAFNTSTPACVLLPISLAFNGTVNAIEVDNTKLFIGGSFSSIATNPKGRLCSYDLSTQAVDAWNPALDGPVLALDADSGILYSGGSFTRVGSIERKRIACFDIPLGNLLPWNPHMGGSVQTILKDSLHILAGGSFFTVGGVERNFIAEINTTSGRPTPFDPDVTGSVLSLFRMDSVLYLGGNFDGVSGQGRNRLAAINVNTNMLMPLNVSFSGPVRCINGEGSNLFVGGFFDTVNSLSRNNIAGIDLNTGTVLGWNPNANGTVNAILPDGNNIYIGGYFLNVNGFSKSRIACVELSTGYPLITWNPSFDNVVYSLSKYNSKLVVGGYFNLANGISRNHLAVLNANTGQLDAYNPDPDNYIKSTFVTGDTLLLGGMFNEFSNQLKGGFVQTNLSTNATGNLSFSCESKVNSVSFAHGLYFSGGAFQSADGLYHPHFAVHYPSPMVGISDAMPEEDEVVIYPNPTMGEFTVSGEDIAEFKLFDAQGKQISKTEANLNPGVYIVEVHMKNGRTISRRLAVTGR